MEFGGASLKGQPILGPCMKKPLTEVLRSLRSRKVTTSNDLLKGFLQFTVPKWGRYELHLLSGSYSAKKKSLMGCWMRARPVGGMWFPSVQNSVKTWRVVQASSSWLHQKYFYAGNNRSSSCWFSIGQGLHSEDHETVKGQWPHLVKEYTIPLGF